MPKPQKELRHNVLTALGALCLDEDVRTPYLHNFPVAPTLHQHSIPITDDEIGDLKQMVPNASGQTWPEFAAVPACPRKPCLYATLGIETTFGAGVMSDAFRTAMFENTDPSFDPILVAYQYGLPLTVDDQLLLLHLLATKEMRAKIVDSLKTLGKKIKDGCPTDFVLKKKIDLKLAVKAAAMAA